MNKLNEIQSGITKSRAQVTEARQQLLDLERALEEKGETSAFSKVILGLAKAAVDDAESKLNRMGKGVKGKLQKIAAGTPQAAPAPIVKAAPPADGWLPPDPRPMVKPSDIDLRF